MSGQSPSSPPVPSLVFSLYHRLSPHWPSLPFSPGYHYLLFVHVHCESVRAVFHTVNQLSGLIGVLLVYHHMEAQRSLSSYAVLWPRNDTCTSAKSTVVTWSQPMGGSWEVVFHLSWGRGEPDTESVRDVYHSLPFSFLFSFLVLMSTSWTQLEWLLLLL